MKVPIFNHSWRRWMLCMGLLWPLVLLAQLSLHVTSLPTSSPPDADLYVAGSFNQWQPGLEAYRLRPESDGSYSIQLALAPGTYQYKFTRGSWTTVEGTAVGTVVPNRTVTYNGGQQTETLRIAGWEDQSPGSGSTAASNVRLLSDRFIMPQLGRERRIWLYLPPDYQRTTHAYPVLYMHDGQNLFDRATSFAGEWEVDETLNRLHAGGDPGVIVVGIDNGGANRINEYTPWPNPQYGGGQGADYVDFIVQTLKPYIDANYRTLPTAAHTGIMGSSLGGLISLYAGIRYPQVFGRVGVLSPSLWFTNDIYDYVRTVGVPHQQRFYLLGGEGERTGTVNVVADLRRLHELLRQRNHLSEDLYLATHADGQHSEWYWAREFSAAYQWLFAMPTTLIGDPAAVNGLRVWPNPVVDTLQLELDRQTSAQVQLYDLRGQLVLTRQLNLPTQLSLGSLPTGVYWLQVRTPEGYANARLIKR